MMLAVADFIFSGVERELALIADQLANSQGNVERFIDNIWDQVFCEENFHPIMELVNAARTDANLRTMLTGRWQRLIENYDMIWAKVLNRTDHQKTELEVNLLTDSGFEVTAWQGGGIESVVGIQDCPPEVSYKRAVAVDSDQAEAIFISCTGFRTIENIAKLEEQLGKPVISLNQATYADCLRILGVKEAPADYGSLFGKVL